MQKTKSNTGDIVRRNRKNPFAMFPVSAFKLGLNPHEYCLYLYFINCADWSSGECFPGLETAAAVMGMSHSSAKRAKASLEKRGLISVQPRYFPHGGQTSNLYTVYEPEDIIKEETQEITPQVCENPPPVHTEPLTRTNELNSFYQSSLVTSDSSNKSIINLSNKDMTRQDMSNKQNFKSIPPTNQNTKNQSVRNLQNNNITDAEKQAAAELKRKADNQIALLKHRIDFENITDPEKYVIYESFLFSLNNVFANDNPYYEFSKTEKVVRATVVENLMKLSESHLDHARTKFTQADKVTNKEKYIVKLLYNSLVELGATELNDFYNNYQ